MASHLALPAALAAMAGAICCLFAPEPPPAASRVAPQTGAKVRYARDVRPILSDRCFTCHGPDEKARKAGLRLDESSFATAPRKDGAAIVPGDPSRSLVVSRIASDDPDDTMPPPESHKKALTAAERDVISRWIEQGAAYEPHWAFTPPSRPQEPAVRDASWCRTPIDRFILAALEEQELAPSPEADRATLCRRVTLDLTGLPPTPEELAAFAADASPDAYERLVDRLLTQEPWRSRTAERLAAPWLDAARYADTCGIHMDNGRQMWLWRDWVLNAYRDGMPFDRFITEQLAGDLLEHATDEQKIASGFNRNHVTSDEGGAIPEEYLVEYGVDRVSTTSSVLLGLTMGCARCHDHKYDPITTKDFYSFFAFFNSVEEPGLYSQTADSNRAYEPFLAVPTPEQKARLAKIEEQLASLDAKQKQTTPEEEKARADYFAHAAADLGIAWTNTRIEAARSEQGATFTLQPDGSMLAGGKNPDRDVHEFTLTTEAAAKGPRLLMLEALTDPSLGMGRVGRAPNGNVVLSGIEIAWATQANPAESHLVAPRWIWAAHSQTNGDYHVTNALLDEEGTARGWAVDADNVPGPRTLLLLADQPMGDGSPLRVTVRLKYRSIYSNHVFGRVRFALGSCDDARTLPATAGTWHMAGPFPAKDRATLFDETFGPESITSLDLKATFGEKKTGWTFSENFKDGVVVGTPAGLNAVYMARTIYTVAGATLDLSLGSDDGFRLFVNGVEAAKNRIERSAMPDQDKARIDLKPGRNTIVFKVVNTGGDGAFYWKASAAEPTMPDGLVPAIYPASSRTAESQPTLDAAWKVTFSPVYRERKKEMDALVAERKGIDAAVPRAMVMKETATPRETFVLTRGQYDRPDKSRPVHRAVPASLGSLPEGASADRLGLVKWMLSPSNPLVARVAANRVWEMLMGVGLVRTSEDFGLQGEWPSHPELLDWLAVDLREQGWDTRRLIRTIVTSAVYRQSSAWRADARAKDPENRLLASSPRRRLSAEQVRDSALFVSGLLVEKFGGPSVKPYQPEGLWQEVAMPSSNTREYKPGRNEENWRRSLYTYWKRASPPPSLLTFDAPTREFCVIRRNATSTPLQALVLWNDPQYVEAARVLAQRTLKETPQAADADAWRLTRMHERCTGLAPKPEELSLLREALNAFRERFKAAREDASKLITVGDSPVDASIDASELASWTMMASSVFNLYRTTTQE